MQQPVAVGYRGEIACLTPEDHIGYPGSVGKRVPYAESRGPAREPRRARGQPATVGHRPNLLVQQRNAEADVGRVRPPSRVLHADARVVAAQDQKIAEALVGQMPGLALQGVAIEILAGEVNHGLAPGVAQRPGERERRT